MTRALVASDTASLFGDTEFTIRDISHDIAAKAYQRHLEQKNGYQGASITCPHCDAAAAYHGQRRHRLVGLCGDISCCRAYYYCRHCGQGFCPFDQQAGIGAHHLTPAAEQLATLAGAVGDSFDKASHLLEEMAGVRLSESTVERTTEDVGGRLAAVQGQGITFGPDVPWHWHRDAKGRRVAYVTLDASGTRQQGPGGRHADGRMAYVGGVYNPWPPSWLRPCGPAPPVQARYVSGLYSLAQMGPCCAIRRQR